jgi:DNA-binding transcriptional ArsR family regulator
LADAILNRIASAHNEKLKLSCCSVLDDVHKKCSNYGSFCPGVHVPAIDPTQFESSFLFSIIGESHRLRILRYLLLGPRAVNEIGRKTKMEKTLLSKHLKALRNVGLIYSTRNGRNLVYQMNPQVITPGKKNSLKLHCCEIVLKKI